MHKTQPTALAEQQSAPAEAHESIDALPERVRVIATLRGLGYSYREIGRLFGVTPQAVSLVLGRHKRSIKRLGRSGHLHHLSARAVNALGRHGIRTPEQARDREILSLLRNERNCGRKTLGEIENWLTKCDLERAGQPPFAAKPRGQVADPAEQAA